MRSFNLTIGTTATIAVPEQFLADMRIDAMSENATPFLKAIHEQNEDDDDFLLAILTNGIRIGIREELTRITQTAGMSLRLAPAQVLGTSRKPPPEDAQPLLLEVKKTAEESATTEQAA